MGIGVVDDHDVEGLVAREVEDVATLEAQTPRIDIRETGACAGKHLLREVEGDDRLRPQIEIGALHDAGSATDVEHARSPMYGCELGDHEVLRTGRLCLLDPVRSAFVEVRSNFADAHYGPFLIKQSE